MASASILRLYTSALSALGISPINSALGWAVALAAMARNSLFSSNSFSHLTFNSLSARLMWMPEVWTSYMSINDDAAIDASS